MKHNILYLFILVFLSFTSSNASEIKFTPIEKEYIKNNPLITVGAERDWAPFDYVENGKYTGVAKDYLDLITKKSGLKFDYILDTWINLIQKTKDKKIDLLPCIIKTPKREKFLFFTDEYVKTRDYVVVNKNNSDIQSNDDLDGKTMAIVKGYANAEIFQKKYPNIKIYYTDSFVKSLDAVITKKADFIISNIAIVNYHIKKNNLTQLDPKFYFEGKWTKLHMAVGHHNEILQDIIAKALSSITSEEKKIIYKKWIDKNVNEDDSRNNTKLNLTQKELNFIKEKKDIYIANEFDWYPYDFYEDNTPKGYVIDYIKIVSKKIGLNPIFITDRWGKLIKRFKQTEIDLLPVIGYNVKRTEYLLFTNFFIQQELTIIAKRSENDLLTIDDLKDKKIGMMKNYNLTNTLKKEYPHLNVIDFNSEDDIFKAIQNDSVDATILNNILANYYIKKNYYDILKSNIRLDLKGFDSKLYMGVGKSLPILHKIINKAIDSMSKKELKELENKWIKPVKSIDFML